MPQSFFFATRNDLMRLWTKIETASAILALKLPGKPPSQLERIEAIKTLGRASARYIYDCAQLLVCSKPWVSEDQVSITLGGSVGRNILLPYILGTTLSHPSAETRRRYTRMQRQIAKSFSKANAVFLGPEAQQLLKKGTRLTFNADWPKREDLPRDAGPI